MLLSPPAHCSLRDWLGQLSSLGCQSAASATLPHTCLHSGVLCTQLTLALCISQIVLRNLIHMFHTFTLMIVIGHFSICLLA
jgi:hypothetical protein